MSIIPHEFMPRSMFEMENWLHPTLEAFDPFDELDNMLARNLQWMTRPSFMEPMVTKPRVPNKYRVTIDCAGFNPKSLKTEVKEGKLFVTGHEETKDDADNYSKKEFKKTYMLPENVEADKLVSFFAGGNMVVEFPLKSMKESHELIPKITEKHGFGHVVDIECELPPNIDPSKLSVTCKDRDLIVKTEEMPKAGETGSKVTYYKRCTLPENTNFKKLKCHIDNNKLLIEAPMKQPSHEERQIPVRHVRHPATRT